MIATGDPQLDRMIATEDLQLDRMIVMALADDHLTPLINGETPSEVQDQVIIMNMILMAHKLLLALTVDHPGVEPQVVMGMEATEV